MASDVLVALLRGINVGGSKRVEMARLRDALSSAGLGDVATYINTGNVLFRSPAQPTAATEVVEQAIEDEFGFRVPVLVRTGDAVVETAQAIPDEWVNDSTMKCDVMFLWDAADRPGVVDDFVREDIDHLVQVPGAVIWRVDRADVTKSGMMRLAGTDLYGQMTVRNVNTVRKLADLVSASDR
jgi:uncharacterized protein (DUF1697 family)